MSSILNTSQEGYRWLDRQDAYPQEEDEGWSDSFGTDQHQHKFFFDPDGFYKIVLDPAILAFANPLLEMKFGNAVGGMAPVYLMWEKCPAAGIPVVDIISDAERTWSMFKAWFERTSGRLTLKREEFSNLLKLLDF